MPTYVSDYTALLSDYYWTGGNATPTVVTYSFPTTAPGYYSGEADFTQAYIDTFVPFTERQIGLAEQAFDAWAALSGISFVEVAPGEGDINFGNYSFALNGRMSGFTGYAYYPNRDIYEWNLWDDPVGGDVFINSAAIDTVNYGLIAHEIGHALGLEHPHGGDLQLQAAFDNGSYTVMSYNRNNGQLGPATFDEQAMVHFYGPPIPNGSDPQRLQLFAVDTADLTTTQVWGSGSSEIIGSSLHDRIEAGGGDDLVGGYDGNDALLGESGNDTLLGGAGDDTLNGGDGNDRLIGGRRWDDEEGGRNTVSYERAGQGVTIVLGDRVWNGSDWANAWGDDSGTDVFYGIQDAIGGGGDDHMTGDARDNMLHGGGGDDTLADGGGSDTLRGGAGSDTAIVQYASTDMRVDMTATGLAFRYEDVVTTFESIELFEFTDKTLTLAEVQALAGQPSAVNQIDGTGGADTLTGTSGNDEVRAGAASDLINAGGGDDNVNAGIGFDTVNGGSGNDTVFALNGFDQLNGEAGNDLLHGNFGNDTLDGGTGHDELQGGLGWDSLIGGDGNDLLVARNGFDTLEGGAGNDTLQGNNGNDLLTGGADDDLLEGGFGSDTLAGDTGDDQLFGGNGADTLMGGDGDDRVEGNGGGDLLNGGTGNDVLRGGIGADTFVFELGSGADRIVDLGLVDTVQLDADLLSEASPMPANLTGYAGTNADGFVVLDFGDGDTLTFTDITGIDAILGNVTFA